jgi:hypothetical protein
VATSGVGAACGRFGFSLYAAATFYVFPRLQITNDGLFYIVFESVPNGSEHVDGWLFWIRAQQLLPNLFRGNVLATNSGESKLKNWRNKIQVFLLSLAITCPSKSLVNCKSPAILSNVLQRKGGEKLCFT